MSTRHKPSLCMSRSTCHSSEEECCLLGLFSLGSGVANMAALRKLHMCFGVDLDLHRARAMARPHWRLQQPSVQAPSGWHLVVCQPNPPPTLPSHPSSYLNSKRTDACWGQQLATLPAPLEERKGHCSGPLSLAFRFRFQVTMKRQSSSMKAIAAWRATEEKLHAETRWRFITLHTENLADFVFNKYDRAHAVQPLPKHVSGHGP